MDNPVPLVRKYSLVWALWLGVTVIGEVMGMSFWARATSLFTLALVELFAVLRRGEGDTLSKHVWYLINPTKEVGQDRVGVAAASGVFAVYLAYSAALITPLGMLIPAWGAPALMLLSPMIWLILHFITRGKTG